MRKASGPKPKLSRVTTSCRAIPTEGSPYRLTPGAARVRNCRGVIPVTLRNWREK